MAVDMFLKLGGVKGESVDASHKDEIDVLAWSWGMSQNGTTHMGKGGGAGKVNVQDMTFTKKVDRATPNLMAMCSNGKQFPEVKLTVRKAGEQPLEYLVVTMKDVMISSVATGGSDGSDTITENVSLNFAKVQLDYVPQKADGTGDAAVQYAWDIAANKAL